MYFVEIRNRSRLCSMLLFSLLFSLYQAYKTSLPLPLFSVGFWNWWYFCFPRFWNCSDSVIFLFFQIFELFRQSGIFVFLDFRTVPTVVFLFFQILELFRQSGIFVFLDVLTVPTVFYFSIRLFSCSDSGIFVFLDFLTVPTEWYFCFFRFLNCSDRVVFLFFQIFELFRQRGIFVFLDC